MFSSTHGSKFLRMGRHRRFFPLRNVVKFIESILVYDPTGSSGQPLELGKAAVILPILRVFNHETESE